jgi:hypothetical protein
MNRELSPDRLAFQIAGTTISPNYPREEFETLDREVLVVSADVPPQEGETDEQRVERKNANADRAACRQQELAAAARPQDNTQATPDKATTMSGCKHQHLQQTISNISNMSLDEAACTLETSRGTLSRTAMRSTTPPKPTWEPLLPH